MKLHVTKMRGSYDCGWATASTIVKAYRRSTANLYDELDVDGVHGIKYFLPDIVAQGTYPWSLHAVFEARGLEPNTVIGDRRVRSFAQSHLVAGLTRIGINPHWVVLAPGDQLGEVCTGGVV